MNAPLYSIDILRLATESAEFPRLDTPHASVERRSATCGSRVLVDLAFDESGRVTRYGQEVRACALGQASATVFARGVVGRSRDDLVAARDALAEFLAGSRASLPDWPGIEVLERARGYSARHASIRLAFEAAAEAAQIFENGR